MAHGIARFGPASRCWCGCADCRLANGYSMVWESGGTLMENCEAALRFKLLSPRGQPMRLEPYMGMFGHAAVRRDDGAVFAHLHPMGTISMASVQSFEKRERGGNVLGSEVKEVHQTGTTEAVSFPYEFPQGGSYRIWVQMKSGGNDYTGVFDAEVQMKKQLKGRSWPRASARNTKQPDRF